MGVLHSGHNRLPKRCDCTMVSDAASIKDCMPISIIRPIVAGQSLVCRVEKTRWPVIAALIAISAVSISRISPTMIISGSCRRKAFSAAGKVIPTSWCTLTWLMPLKLNSTGSSAVRILVSSLLREFKAE